MPPKRTPTIATKLAAVDHIKYEQFCRADGRTKTEVAREAILWYMKAKEQEMLDARETALEKRLRKMEDRMAGLLVKLGVGVYGLEHLFWTRTDEGVRKKLFEECYVAGVRKVKTKLRPEEEDLKKNGGG